MATSHPDPDQALQALEALLKSARQPALIEPGEKALPLVPGSFLVERGDGRLVLQAWDERRNIVRRITGLTRQKAGVVELEVERFGKRTGALLLVDLARPGSHGNPDRLVMRERFRSALFRQFPGWKIAEISSSPDLEHSLSPTYPRALLQKGACAWAAMAAPAEPVAASGVLSFGLIWLDYLRRREHRLAIEGLALFLPYGREIATCLRLRWLNPQAARFAVFVYDEQGYEMAVDPADHGNLDTRLDPCRASDSPSTRHDAPEALLEAQVRRHIQTVDAALCPAPVYRQAPVVAGVDRGIIDLLAVEHDGRLVVLELKATADLHLPLQALDYWMRVGWHAARDEFSAHGYFPGVRLTQEPPRLLLVAPALEFHPTTEIILRYLSPRIEVERVGLGVEWQEAVKVMFRIRAAQRPH